MFVLFGNEFHFGGSQSAFLWRGTSTCRSFANPDESGAWPVKSEFVSVVLACEKKDA